MSVASDKYWKQMAPKLRRALGYAPPTIEEAEAEMGKAEAVPMTDDEIERIVDYATGEPLTTAKDEVDFG